MVKDPASGRYYRFGEAEASILRLLDGSTPLDTIRRQVEQRFDAPLSSLGLQGFVEKLRSFGLVERSASSSPPPPLIRGPVRGSLLYLRFKAFDPDQLLDRMVPRLGFLFTPRFVVLSTAGVAAALIITVANRADIARDVRNLFNLHSLILAWFTVYAIIVVHEFAHGLTCKRFGGRVREMGFLLIYFQPAFYCNVSDAWLFPERSRRLWVTFAGAYVDIFMWAVATLAWRLTETASLINQLALVVVATSAVKTLINLNPLIKLDGYYLLSDYLEISNLRGKAQGYLRAGMRRLFVGGSSEVVRPTRRETRILLAYGLLAGVYSVWLLGWVALWFGRYMVTRYQGWGLFAFTLVLLATFRAPVARTLDTLRAMFRSFETLRTAVMRGARVFFVLAGALAILWFGKMELKVAGDFTILPAQNADVRTDVEGIIDEIRGEEGDRITKGEVIARLSDRDYLAEIEKVRAQIEESQARLRLLRLGPRGEELSLGMTEVEKAGERLKYAREKRQMLDKLFVQRLVSQKEFAESEEEVSVRQKELEESEGRLKVLQAGNRKEAIESVEAEVRRWEAQRRYLEEQLLRIAIISPITGVITTPKLKERVGEHVNKGDLIAKVYDVTTVTAEIAVPEKEISDVRIGQRVEIRARSFPRKTFEGTVTSIAPTVSLAQDALAGRTILVRTRLDNLSGLLKPEMTGTAKIHGDRARLLTLLTRRLSRTLRVEFWSWW
ncbi:MAG TPA: efflux RND transporter periplasmic adaptor subunit [Candidatus Polarisedimenticolia bacterium]|nr:efflux RND transporter periplasmic adaptor subunit [Candidatus Polarisedimenticolia bacterium]